ncbi:uncharacterized protein I206_103156 [Kwoniella pini CBS 10737]|uniref:Uncharacterized protein n=1 Tax=Kwoniella pini CBS 10737 TaxID=1296096 RepID=A0A1B9IAC3_9TREE|nr:uncharacterized protein I206_01839 [Kwoniella pini CBS 10737]OCF52548.1 hypothetical protein I206_01839 [Kwoniella pini CBS 10737]
MSCSPIRCSFSSPSSLSGSPSARQKELLPLLPTEPNTNCLDHNQSDRYIKGTSTPERVYDTYEGLNKEQEVNAVEPVKGLTDIVASRNLEGKRKRSLTHFNGIPLSILDSSSTSSKSSSPLPRQIITPKKIRDLGELFTRTKLDNDDEEEQTKKSKIGISINRRREKSNASESTESYSSTSISTPSSSARSKSSIFDYESSDDDPEFMDDTFVKKGNTAKMSQEEGYEYDDDTDSEDDVIFLMSP